MQNSSRTTARRSLLLSIFVLAIVAAATLVATQYQSQAVAQEERGKQPIAVQDRRDAEYFDIRDRRGGKNEVAEDSLRKFREDAGRTAATLADTKDAFVRGEERLKEDIPTLKVEYNHELQNPEVIAPDILKGGGRLTGPTSESRASVLRNFVLENKELVGLSGDQVGQLRVTADYKNPVGELSFARLEQFIGDIPVFRAEIRAGFAKDGSMFRVINNSAPALDYNSLSRNFGDPALAVTIAESFIPHEFKRTEPSSFNAAESTDLKVKFGEGDWATTAEKMYFPIEPGVARPAWRVLSWEPGDAYYVIVDAETGAMLYRENITRDQTQAATYNVYANTNSLLRSMQSPAPFPAPGLLDPSLGTQPPLQPRTNVTLIGNEAPYTFNNNGWITDGTNGVNGHTDGNAIEAGVDRDNTNGVDAPVQGTNRVFNFDYTPGAGPNNGPGDDPTTSPAFQNGASTNLFYVTNRFHDETYLLGWTEEARNMQHDNFGRGGIGNDRVSAEAQDDTLGSFCPSRPCVNNANFSTPADGGRGRMQMYIWNSMNPDRDGDLDAEIIIHEFTHGLFGRLHNGTGGTQAGQMNEGSADFFAHVLLSVFTDPVNTISTTGGYATLNLRGAAPFSSTGNYYYGIRRFPKAPLAFTGGPNNRPHNPLTYADIDPAQINLTNGAFAPAFNGSATAVHDGGEIWSSMMWEVRTRLVQRLGAEAGNRKVLQLAMDGMKIAPANPTMKAERDAILAAAQANGNTSDMGDVWAGFAARGLGFSAQNTTGNTVVEGFDLPNAVVTDPFSVSDAPGDNDGFPEPGENVLLSISVTNTSGAAISNVQISVNGGSNVNYGTVANGATVTNQVPYFIPEGAACGSMHPVTISGTTSEGPMSPVIQSFRLGEPVGGAPVTFSNMTTINIPANQPTTTSGPAGPYPSIITASGLTGNKTITVELTGIGHSWVGDMDVMLESPSGQKYIIMSDVFESSNRAPNMVVATLQLSDLGTALLPASGQPPATGSLLPTNRGTVQDPFDGPAPAGPYLTSAPGGSDTFASAFGENGTAMNGDWKLWIDDDTSSDAGPMAGWKITFGGNDYTCSTGPATNFSVGGRVVDTAGRGVPNAEVTLVEGSTTFVARTSPFGYFSIASVPGGVSYTATVTKKRLTFTPQSVNPNANITDLNFTAVP